MNLIVFILITFISYLYCRFKIDDFINNVSFFLKMGFFLFLPGCIIITFYYNINALKESLLLITFRNFNFLIIGGYISCAIAFFGYTEKTIRYIMRRLKLVKNKKDTKV